MTMPAVSAPKPRHKNGLQIIGSLLFPSFGELQFIMIIVTTAVVIARSPILLHQTLEFLLEPRFYLILAVIIFIIVRILMRQTLPDGLKVWSCFVYYGFFALIAISALQQQNLHQDLHSLLDFVNRWLIRFILVISIVRGVAALLILRLESTFLNNFVITKFKNTQYRPAAFLLVISLVVVSTFLVSNFYTNPATVALLGFTYANICLTVIKSYVDNKLTYTA